MKKFVCTWLCVDSAGDESNYSQMLLKGKSSSRKFLDVYWKNICVLFLTTRKFNPNVSLLFFTNSIIPETVDSVNIVSIFKQLDVEIIYVDFDYKTPDNYFSSWRNTFFEFSVIKKMVSYSENDNDIFLLLDSDCVITKSLDVIWERASLNGFLAYLVDYPNAHIVNGLSREMMKEIYEDLEGKKLSHIPKYYGGELLLATRKNLRTIFSSFDSLWITLLERNSLGLKKFNTEEHVLSYLFYKNSLEDNLANDYIKRMWTQPFIFRNVERNDHDYIIWHLPQEKKYGMIKIFEIFIKNFPYAMKMSNEDFIAFLKYYLTIPSIPAWIYISRILPIQIIRKFYHTVKH